MHLANESLQDALLIYEALYELSRATGDNALILFEYKGKVMHLKAIRHEHTPDCYVIELEDAPTAVEPGNG